MGTQVTSVNLEKPAGAYVLSGPQKLMSKKEEKNLVTWGNAECIGEIREETLNLKKPRRNKNKITSALRRSGGCGSVSWDPGDGELRLAD